MDFGEFSQPIMLSHLFRHVDVIISQPQDQSINQSDLQPVVTADKTAPSKSPPSHEGQESHGDSSAAAKTLKHGPDSRSI